MEKHQDPASRTYLVLLAIAGWFALVGQFYLIIINRQTTIPEVIVRYFTFYTILTNILIAVCCTILLAGQASALGKYFARVTTLTAITVNITIVGTVYNTILRFLWQPQGFQFVVDELLHTIIPIAFIVYWVLFVPKGELKWTCFFSWLIYPLVYLAVVLVRGELSGYYPYPFLDVSIWGYSKVILNSCGIAVAFIFVALLFIKIDKWMSKKEPA
ncbi:MAG: Pr6Pr family membrane protein [Mucilaginibacter sp.]